MFDWLVNRKNINGVASGMKSESQLTTNDVTSDKIEELNTTNNSSSSTSLTTHRSVLSSIRWNRRIWDNEDGIKHEDSSGCRRMHRRWQMWNELKQLRDKSLTREEFERYQKAIYEKYDVINHKCYQQWIKWSHNNQNTSESNGSQTDNKFSHLDNSTASKLMSSGHYLPLIAIRV